MASSSADFEQMEFRTQILQCSWIDSHESQRQTTAHL